MKERNALDQLGHADRRCDTWFTDQGPAYKCERISPKSVQGIQIEGSLDKAGRQDMVSSDDSHHARRDMVEDHGLRVPRLRNQGSPYGVWRIKEC